MPQPVAPAGRFITVEGTEGAGKTTNLDYIEALLTRAGHSVLRTREPGGTPFAEKLRDLLLEPQPEPVAPLAELLLMFAAREQHLVQVIRPALHAGQWVLCDRFTDATFAYQGGGRQLDMHHIETLAALVHGDLEPDLTLFLDVPVAAGLARIAGRPSDRIEREAVDFFERVRAVYLARARSAARFRIVDAGRPLAAVQADIETQLRQFLQALP